LSQDIGSQAEDLEQQQSRHAHRSEADSPVLGRVKARFAALRAP
jgi:hypothetical protein